MGGERRQRNEASHKISARNLFSMLGRMMLGWAALSVLIAFVLALIVGGVYSVAKVNSYFNPPKKQLSYQEKLEAIGIVEGQVNEFRIGKALLRVPADFSFGIRETDPIRNGFVDEFYTSMTYPQYFEPWKVDAGLTEYDGRVRVELRAFGSENPNTLMPKADDYLMKGWIKKEDLGLYEVTNRSLGGAWGGKTYTPIDESFRSQLGNRILFECVGHDDEIYTCRTSFKHPMGPVVEFFFGGPMLPRWREVYEDVVEKIDLIVVNE